MNGSPLSAWDGVEAYFTFADSPVLVSLFLLLTLLVIGGVIAHSVKHENEAFKRFS
ncbi:hypothetical protein [Rhodospirillaceae bacterium SYSU D60014]|uniref:hypothetical protein n=1 Tax=Virgifigura deserti TaxID=2268457 RepID=UPI0013C46ACC